MLKIIKTKKSTEVDKYLWNLINGCFARYIITSEMDYIKAQMTLKKANWKEKCKYYAITFLFLLIKLLIIVAPIVFILLTIRYINI